MPEIPEFARYNLEWLEGTDPSDYLKPCKCGCGERPRLTFEIDNDNNDRLTVVCKWCGAGLTAGTEIRAIELWNER